MNDTGRQQRALQLFDELVDLAPARRVSRLRALAQEDPALHADVLAMLEADDRDGGLLESDPAHLFDANVDGSADAGEGDHDALIGQRLGPWRIERVIGRGGMGAVYRGERIDGAFRQQAAIKRIRLGLDDAEQRRRFLRERQLLAQLQHPNIATLLDGGVDAQGAPYFAMELVDGVPVDQWCDQQRLDLRGRVRLFLQVCRAVRHAHQNLVVHRDLKPNNILVTGDGVAKLLDFGIAKLVEGGDGETATRDRALTPEYAAPEQLRGDPVTTATDQYALGVILYALLSGATPFPASAGNALKRRLASLDLAPESITRAAARVPADLARTRRIASPAALSQALRGDLAAIVDRTLQPEPNRRYASVDALTSDLKAWLDGRPVNARLGHRGYRLRKFVARHRWGVAAGMAGLFAIVSALGIAVLQAREAGRQATLARANARHAEASAERAAATRDFAVSMFTSANPVQNKAGAQATAPDLLRAAAARVDEELAQAPESQAHLRAAIGTGLYQLGDREGGRALLDDGITQMRQLGIGGLPLVDALQSRAIAQRETNDDEGAERDIRAALAELARVDGGQRLWHIKLRTSLATIESQRGNLREALRLHQANLRDRSALLGDGHGDTAVDWNNVAALHTRLHQFPEAGAAYQRADDILVRSEGPDFPRRAWTLMGVASARMHTAEGIGSARSTLDEAQRILDLGLGANHPMVANLLNLRGSLLARQGRFAEAVPLLSDAVARSLAAKSDTTVHYEANLGVALLALGRSEDAHRHLAAAVAALARDRAASEPQLNRAQAALGLARFHLGERERGEREIRAALQRLHDARYRRTDSYAFIAADLATALEALGKHTEARAMRQRAQATFAEVYGARHPTTLAAARLNRAQATARR